MKTTATLAAAMVCLLCAMVLIAWAGDAAKSAKSQSASGLPPTQTTLTNLQLKSTTFEYDNPGLLLLGNETANIDNLLNFTCPATTCTVTAELHVQLGQNVHAANVSKLCVGMDTGFISPICPLTGEIPSDASDFIASFAFAQSKVTKGKHTIQSQVYTAKEAALENYAITYRLYTP